MPIVFGFDPGAVNMVMMVQPHSCCSFEVRSSVKVSDSALKSANCPKHLAQSSCVIYECFLVYDACVCIHVFFVCAFVYERGHEASNLFHSFASDQYTSLFPNESIWPHIPQEPIDQVRRHGHNSSLSRNWIDEIPRDPDRVALAVHSFVNFQS